MKKLLLTVFCVLFFNGAVFASRNFIEGADFFVDFTQKEHGQASVLRINFTSSEPTPREAEILLRDQLNIYGKIVEEERIAQKKEEEEKAKTLKNSGVPETEQAEEEEEKFKNIVGSVWFTKDAENPVKIKFNDYLAFYAYIGKTKKIVQFPDYINFLRKERDDKKAKDKLKTAAEKALEINTL